MSKKSRFAPAMIAAAAVATVGIGLAPAGPAYTETGHGTVTTLALRQGPRRVGPVQRLERAVVRVVRTILHSPQERRKAASD